MGKGVIVEFEDFAHECPWKSVKFVDGDKRDFYVCRGTMDLALVDGMCGEHECAPYHFLKLFLATNPWNAGASGDIGSRGLRR